ncbi:hypothetical protein L1987_80541 [Smallanthus sonchifolius]|uniref:Uncharacterized protein n=1 Tax=Smallanthus sonchifolius TaxID=185202 RepID=A0ACB8YMW3_9ASTR|nr:hypothetical protein L1987_80541 [Smallanthus sonchifolius]
MAERSVCCICSILSNRNARSKGGGGCVALPEPPVLAVPTSPLAPSISSSPPSPSIASPPTPYPSILGTVSALLHLANTNLCTASFMLAIIGLPINPIGCEEWRVSRTLSVRTPRAIAVVTSRSPICGGSYITQLAIALSVLTDNVHETLHSSYPMGFIGRPTMGADGDAIEGVGGDDVEGDADTGSAGRATQTPPPFDLAFRVDRTEQMQQALLSAMQWTMHVEIQLLMDMISLLCHSLLHHHSSSSRSP